MPNSRYPRVIAFSLTWAWLSTSATIAAQSRDPAAARIVIASLANDSQAGDLDFQGGECRVAGSGRHMDCEFQQVFLTRSPIDADTCLVTTNRFERQFDKQDETTWVSRVPAAGPCGVVDVATLVDEGRAIRWSLEFRTEKTDRRDGACRAPDPPAERFSWKAVRRPLPCRFIQPGAVR